MCPQTPFLFPLSLHSSLSTQTFFVFLLLCQCCFSYQASLLLGMTLRHLTYGKLTYAMTQHPSTAINRYKDKVLIRMPTNPRPEVNLQKDPEWSISQHLPVLRSRSRSHSTVCVLGSAGSGAGLSVPHFSMCFYCMGPLTGIRLIIEMTL